MAEEYPVNDEVLQRAIKKWGYEFNLNMAIEEMAELIVELRHMFRKRPHHVYSELADVRLVIRSMEMMVDDPDLYRAELAVKQERLETRLEQS